MSNSNDEITLRELFFKLKSWWLYLLSKWILVLILVVVGAGIGMFYSIVKKPTYTGRLTFVLSNESKGAGGLASLAGQFGLDVGVSGSGGAFEGENIIELLKSRRIIKRALFKQLPTHNAKLIDIISEQLGLPKAWEKSNRLKKFWPFPNDINQVSPIQDSIIGTIHEFIIKKYLSIARLDKKLSFYEVSTTSPKDIISVYLTKNVVDEASKMYIETKTKIARENLLMLKHEADSLRERLSGTIYSSANRIDQTFNLNPSLQTQRAPIQQNQVQAQVLGMAYGEVVKNLEVAKITLQKEMPLYQIIDEPQLPLAKRRPGMTKTMIVSGIITGLFAVFVLLIRIIILDVIRNNSSLNPN